MKENRKKHPPDGQADQATPKNWLVRNQLALGARQSALAIAAGIVAILWSHKDASSSKLNIEQRFSQRPYVAEGHEHGETLLSIQVWVTNVGNASNYLDPGQFLIDEVNPRPRRLFCDMMYDTSTPTECDQEPPVESRYTRFVEWLQRSTAVGWLWRPTKSFRWIEAGEKDQIFANVYRLRAPIKTIRISSIQ
jgi:hypothetical protein